MAEPFRVRTLLRDATADLHARVDTAFSRADLSDREGYARFLNAQAEAHIAIERAIDRSDVLSFLPDWPARRRADLLLSDLAALGIKPPEGVEAPPLTAKAAILGAAYVLEGSRLGGALLKRSVPAEFPADFLAKSDPAAWRRLLSILDEHVLHVDEIRLTTQAARDAFLLFERSASKYLKADGFD